VSLSRSYGATGIAEALIEERSGVGLLDFEKQQKQIVLSS